MRVLTSRIYRAFPELDRFADDRCDRFMRAARRGTRRTLGRFAVVGLAFAVTMTACLSLGGYQFLSALDHASWFLQLVPGVQALLMLLLVVALSCPAFLAAFLCRDWLLRRRVRHVIRAKGVCSNCGYSLLGVPVLDDLNVVCPECSFTSEVDPALSELVESGAGPRVFSPKAVPPTRLQRLWSPRVRERVRRGLVWTFFALLFAGPTGWGLYEWSLRSQAAQATADRGGVAALNKLYASAQPQSDGPDAWEAFDRAIAIQMTTDDRVWRSNPRKTSFGDEAYPDFASVGMARQEVEGETPRQVEVAKLSEELARDVLKAYKDDGVFDTLAIMASRQRAQRSYSLPPGVPLVNILLPHLGQTRNYARANAARMRLAVEQRDLAEFTSALEVCLAMGRMLNRSPILIETLVGYAIESLSYAEIRRALDSHPPAPWTDAIEQVIQRQRPTMPYSFAIEGERLVSADSVASVFVNPSNVRFGRFSKKFRTATGAGWTPGGLSDRIGSYNENRKFLDSVFDVVSAESMLAPRDRHPGRTTVMTEETSLILPKIYLPSLERALTSCDLVELDRSATPAMLALERYYQRHQGYPVALSELGDLLPVVPLDRWSGKPLGYLRLDPTQGAVRSGYLLYVVGMDGVDNHGATPPGSVAPYQVLNAPLSRINDGFDFVINDPRR